MLGVCCCSPRSLSNGLILRDAYGRMERGLQSDIRCVAVFRVVLNLCVAKVFLGRVISGGSSLSWESMRGCRLLYFWMYIFLGSVSEGRYKCNSIDVLMQCC